MKSILRILLLLLPTLSLLGQQKEYPLPERPAKNVILLISDPADSLAGSLVPEGARPSGAAPIARPLPLGECHHLLLQCAYRRLGSDHLLLYDGSSFDRWIYRDLSVQRATQ